MNDGNTGGMLGIFQRHAYDVTAGAYAEAAQATIRVFVIPFVIVYIACLVSGAIPSAPSLVLDPVAKASLHTLLYVTVVQFGVALVTLGWVIRKPIANLTRRVLVTLNDYCTITAMLAFGGEAMAPLFVVLLWLTIGNGLRYGIGFLVYGTIASVTGVIIAAFANNFWRTQYFLTAAFLLTIVLVPIYVYMLLRSVRTAHRAEQIASQAKSQFLAVMSQEFRAPLTGIVAMTQMLLSRPQADADRELTRTIKSSTEALLLVVNDLRELSTAEAIGVRFNHEDFKIKSVASRLNQMLAQRAQEKGVALSITIAPDVPETLRGDQHRLTQALLNLLHNAIKLTARGDVALGIQMKPTESPVPQLEFNLTISGATTDTTSVRANQAPSFLNSGVGSSITIARNLIEHLGGSIKHVENADGTTAISALIPFEHASALPSVSAAEFTPVPASTSNSPSQADVYAQHRKAIRSLRILSVEDQRPNRIMLQSILEKAGHRATMCADSERAVNYLIEEQFDLVLLDVHMPVLSGIDVVNRLRSIEEGREHVTPVIFLTADLTQQTMNAAIRAGGTQVLTKPIKADQLLRALANIAGEITARERAKP